MRHLSWQAVPQRVRGGVLLGVVIMVAIGSVICLATLALTTAETKSAVVGRMRLQARYVAESGVEQQINDLRQMRYKMSLSMAMAAIDALAGRTTYPRQTLAKDGTSIGDFTVTVPTVTAPTPISREITIVAEGFVPGRNEPNAQHHRVTAVVRVGLFHANVFDYVYFIHNWGRIYTDKIYIDGNARSNGFFDCGNFKAKIDGVPRFEEVEGTDLLRYLDDNGDGLEGNDGGLYSSWLVNADSIFGQASRKWSAGDANAGRCDPSQVGQFANQFEYWSPVPMPNLVDLAVYEQHAKSSNGSITIGGTTVCGPVLGDDAGEPQNLCIRGTAAAPIVINGTVVVRGSAMISGVVQGKGMIYVGGNVYVPQDLVYVKEPQPLPTPGSRNECDLENWLAHNKYDCDILGLFARGHIVVGDYTNSTWQSRVGAILADARNMTKEDAGMDGVPGTRAGRDGILGTADDDTLEGDGVWTVERYTQSDADRGLIPAGYSVGDPIPGSGEDLDGDGKYTGATQVAHFAVPAELTNAYWAGNVLTSTFQPYSALASTAITRLDAVFYTNHTFAMSTIDRSNKFVLNGALIARSEATSIDTKDITFSYDYRLMADVRFNFDLPLTWGPVRTIVMRRD
jgi:hypothetical protein